MSSSAEEKEITVSTPEGEIVAKQKTVDSFEQSFDPLDEEKEKSIEAWEFEAHRFVKAYLGSDSQVTLKTCDEAFSAWQREEEKKFTNQEVISYLGAFLGQRCVEELDMEWRIVTDQYGWDYSVQAKDSEVRGFPLSSVAKRVKANTHIFMVPVFYSIKQALENEDYKK